MSKEILHIDSNEFEEVVLKSDVPVIIDFYSDDCAPCEVLAPIYEKMAEKYGDYIKFVKIFRQENREFAKSINVTGSPTVLFYKDGKEIGKRLSGFMNKPQVRIAIEEILGDVIPTKPIKEINCDILILGAGAAGLSAGIYAARAKMNTIIIDESVPGGQTASTYHVENYPGTPGMVRGKDIINNMRNQATSFGAKIEDLKEVSQVNLNQKIKSVMTEDTIYHAKSVILASGARPKALPAEFADEFKGRGVHYCATCDGSMYQDREVVVIGGGEAAVEESEFLTRFASKVTLIVRSNKLKASQTSIDKLLLNRKVSVIWNTKVTKVNGLQHSLSSVVLENLKTGETSEYKTDGAFVYIGSEPMSYFYTNQIKLDEWGYVVASEDTKTNIEGVFVAGDIRTKSIRQVVTAASDGAVAGIMAEKYISNN